ncbi:hypothetical protein, partial [Acidianus sp. RZ1]|uniref:hypothetical protein n=1 Tax=Acidianus sp. RZ1 TaxID=1540082 RepID=UPI001C0FCBCB
NNIFKSFIKSIFYLIIPLFLFPLIRRSVSAFPILLKIPYFSYIVFLAEGIIAVFLTVYFVRQINNIYFSIYTLVITKLIRIKSALLKRSWILIISTLKTLVILLELSSAIFYFALATFPIATRIPMLFLSLLGYVSVAIFIPRLTKVDNGVLYSNLIGKQPTYTKNIKITKKAILKLRKRKNRKEIGIPKRETKLSINKI